MIAMGGRKIIRQTRVIWQTSWRSTRADNLQGLPNGSVPTSKNPVQDGMNKKITDDLTDDKMNPLVETNDERFADLNNIKLASDESILHKTQTIIIKGVRYEAVLTNKRLITVESETGHIREDILFEEIDLAISGENKFHEPVITLITVSYTHLTLPTNREV